MVKSVLVVLSGGQDSCTALFDAVHNPDYNRVEAVSFKYGQRHARELDAASFVYHLARKALVRKVDGSTETALASWSGLASSRSMIDWTSAFMPLYHRVIDLGRPFEGVSPLTDAKAELEQYDSVAQMDAKLTDRVELTFVPGRNAVFLSLAYGIAVARGLDAVVTGVNGADAGNYPDCTEEFVHAMEVTMRAATRSGVQILAPYQGWSKAAIVQRASSLPGCFEALAFTVTDYAGEYPPGRNHSSVLRAAGFAEAGRSDPLITRATAEGLL